MPNKVIIESNNADSRIEELTGDELAEYNARVTALENARLADVAAEAQKKTDAQSGNQKLLDLGLTQAEATALTGYTPE